MKVKMCKRKKKLPFSSTKTRRYEKKINPCALSPIRFKHKKSIKRRLREKRGYPIKRSPIFAVTYEEKTTLGEIAFFEKWLDHLAKEVSEVTVKVQLESIENRTTIADVAQITLSVEFTAAS